MSGFSRSDHDLICSSLEGGHGMKIKTGEKTLLASVLMSAPGPLVVGTALFFGRSSTQLADFVRRSAELIAIIVSYLIYRKMVRDKLMTPLKMRNLERTADLSVGMTMCLSGPVILLSALYASDSGDGNVIPGLVIALLGVLTNTWFWLRYRLLNRRIPNGIFAVQSSLYRAKSLVDLCVSLALATVAAVPGTALAGIVDLTGSVVVAAYLIINGVIIIRGKKNTSIKSEIHETSPLFGVTHNVSDIRRDSKENTK